MNNRNQLIKDVIAAIRGPYRMPTYFIKTGDQYERHGKLYTEKEVNAIKHRRVFILMRATERDKTNVNE